MSNLPLLAFQHHVGQLFIDPGEIEFVCSLGDGELALVEKGRWHTQNGLLPVVVKGYKPFVVGSPQDFRELLLEASKLHRLRHNNITRFLGLGCFSHGTLAEVRESMFMVEEYVGTRTLRKVISEQMRCRLKNLYDMQTALRWAAEIAAALAALHEAQPAYIHGDVKADNAFLTDCENLSRAMAKLGDLKPHRHAYDREPSTLSHHQQYIATAPTKRQSSLELYSLERSSMGSTHSWQSSSMGSKNNAYPNKGPWADSMQQQQPFCKDVSEPCKQLCSKPQQDSSVAAANAYAGTPAQTQSVPVPILSTKAEGAVSIGSCPADWNSSALFKSCADSEAASRVHTAVRSSSLPEELGTIVALRMCRSLPITSCLSASEMSEAVVTVATATEALDMKTSDAAVISKQQEGSDGCGTALDSSSNGGSWWHRRTTELSDSASSTKGGSGNQGTGKGKMGLISLADAEDEDESLDSLNLQLLQHVAAAGSQGSLHELKPSAAASHSHQTVTGKDTLVHEGQRPRSKSDLSNLLQRQKEQQLAGQPLETSKSAPADVYKDALQDHAVHRGVFMESGLLDSLAAEQQTAKLDMKDKQQHRSPCYGHGQQQQDIPTLDYSACAEQQPSPFEQEIPTSAIGKVEYSAADEATVDAVAAKVQKQSQAKAPLSWELSPTGAASPCGAVHSTMLDLFADFAEDDEQPISRRTRDHYSLAPGSLIQQRMSTSSYSTASACQTSAFKSSASWSHPANTNNGSKSSGILIATPQLQQQQNAVERPVISKVGAPTAIESKQHGSNSAFAALTAIDCITEETSSIATDSVMGSCPPSRESTAHGGGRFFADVSVPATGGKDQEASNSGRGSSHFARGLNLSILLSARSSSGNMGLVSSGSGEGLYAGSPAPASAVLPIEHKDSNGLTAKLQQSTQFAAGDQPLTSSVACAANSILDMPAKAEAATVGVASPKKVRFDMSRPAGSTPSRDYGLLYAAPELLSGQRQTEKVDVFAFGVLLYELLSRSLLFPHCAAAVAQNRSHRGSSRHGGSRHARDKTTNSSTLAEATDVSASEDSDTLPEQQLLLSYAQLVAGGYRPPFPSHFPETVQQLIGSCWAAEPHERPRMTEVLQQLQELAQDRHVVLQLNSYLAGLDDLGYRATGPECSCGCVIC